MDAMKNDTIKSYAEQHMVVEMLRAVAWTAGAIASHITINKIYYIGLCEIKLKSWDSRHKILQLKMNAIYAH